jgi:hypothetical protein
MGWLQALSISTKACSCGNEPAGYGQDRHLRQFVHFLFSALSAMFGAVNR